MYSDSLTVSSGFFYYPVTYLKCQAVIYKLNSILMDSDLTNARKNYTLQVNKLYRCQYMYFKQNRQYKNLVAGAATD